jgi:hypothetical protein
VSLLVADIFDRYFFWSLAQGKDSLGMAADLSCGSTGLNRKKHCDLIPFLKYLIALLVVMSISAVNVQADTKTRQGGAGYAGVRQSKFIPEVEAIFSGGYRRDDLDWNIAGTILGQYVNVLSELEWDDIESYQVKFEGRFVIPKIIAFRGIADYGWIFDGEVQDSDYLGDNRTLEFSRSNNSADDGDVWDVSLAVGYPFRTGRDVVGTITPLVGYSYHEQNLTMTDGFQTIPPLGSFPGLDSTYDTEWKGPWVGIDLNFKAAEHKSVAHRFETFFSYEYHWADYDAEADWNLRTDFQHPKSFTHDADGRGWIIRAGFNFVLHRNVALNFNFDYQDWSTDDGTDKVYFADGTTTKTNLNEVNWTSYSFGLGLSLRF